MPQNVVHLCIRLLILVCHVFPYLVVYEIIIAFVMPELFTQGVDDDPKLGVFLQNWGPLQNVEERILRKVEDLVHFGSHPCWVPVHLSP